MRSDRSQILLIVLGLVVTAMFMVFLWREIFPEYRIYQDAYVQLENFRSEYTHQPPPDFKVGIKQIVLEKPNNGPADVDRCISCHVALQFEHFSSTKLARDINGAILYNADGMPLLTQNENYVWGKLDQKINALLNPDEIAKLNAEGKTSEAKERMKQAEIYRSWQTATVGNATYDMTKVLAMHPLMGKETRPFEFHPINEYGCVSCHNGNGRGLTTEKAHGPVFDGHYETEDTGEKLEFIEKDPQNDPKFSKVFNYKPGSKLLFQTTPLYTGGLVEAKCVRCHQPSSQALQTIFNETNTLVSRRIQENQNLKASYSNDINALISTLSLYNSIQDKGLQKAIEELQKASIDYTLPSVQREAYATQLETIQLSKTDQAQTLEKLKTSLIKQLGSESDIEKLNAELKNSSGQDSTKQIVEVYIQSQASSAIPGDGILVKKWLTLQLDEAMIAHASLASSSINQALQDPETAVALTTDVDALLKTYRKGYNLFIDQACYACHRISGTSRGGIGPELTYEGSAYPWFVKESIVWPQADLKTSTMPNMRLDHDEVEALVTFLLGQNGRSTAVSEAAYKLGIKEWEAGRKAEWEKPIPNYKIKDVKYGMTVFATEGCAACHRLKGYESNVGFKVEKDAKPDFKTLYAEKQWFQKLFPEEISAKRLVNVLDTQAEQIDRRIVDNVRQNSLLEELSAKDPDLLIQFYPNLKFASRAKNAAYKGQPEKLKEWKDRLNRVLMVFIQEYGLGRLIGPRPNWSGVYRSDTWLMEHFRNPGSLAPRSIMPVFPFDDSKFYALTYMLDELGRHNRDSVREIWKENGFSPELAYDIHCLQCHGPLLQGNGPVAEWIYPIPKNLRNPDFMRNLTATRVREAIKHGVKGTPMPPWGETPEDKIGYDGIPVLNDREISLLSDWLFSKVPGGTIIRDTTEIPKWKYSPEDVLRELKKEGNEKKLLDVHSSLFKFKGYVADLKNSPPAVESGVDDLFDTVTVPGYVDEKEYFIKKRYYTQENLERGRDFFDVNCAVCHGKDADGAGTRAGAMLDAKPRMLINLPWLASRDDLRMLRSIKYGVPGTSMTAWGDQTTSLLRLQLVMYIRSLSELARKRDDLDQAIFAAFDEPILAVDLARADASKKVSTTEEEYRNLRQERQGLVSGEAELKNASSKAIELYQKELDALAALKEARKSDEQYVNLKKSLQTEKELFNTLGVGIINSASTKDLSHYIVQAIDLRKASYTYKDGQLHQNMNSKEVDAKQAEILSEILTAIQDQVQLLEKEKKKLQETSSNLPSQDASKLDTGIETLEKTKNRIISNFEEARRLEKEQQKYYLEIQNGKK